MMDNQEHAVIGEVGEVFYIKFSNTLIDCKYLSNPICPMLRRPRVINCAPTPYVEDRYVGLEGIDFERYGNERYKVL